MRCNLRVPLCLTWVSVLVLLAAFGQPILSREVAVPAGGRIDVLFSPRGGCQERIIEEIHRARKSVRVQAHAFTNPAIAAALVEAKKRGVQCEVTLDRSAVQDEYSAAPFLHREGVSILIDAGHAAHNRIIILDDNTIITGSYSFTRASEETDAENLLIIKDIEGVARQYVENYQLHQAHSEAYVRPPGAPRPLPDATASPQPAPLSVVPLATPAPSPGADDGLTVYVTRSGTKYHREGCRHLRTGGQSLKLSEAKVRYSACSVCKPPE